MKSRRSGLTGGDLFENHRPRHEEETEMIEGSNNSPTTRNVRRRGLNRREILAAGVAGAAITGFPYVSRGLAAQTLKFWQFYAPGGGVAVARQMVRGRGQGLERQPRGQGRARVRAQQRLHGRHKAADRVRLGRGPRSLHHQPRRLPSLLQRRRASRPDAVHGAKRARRLPSERHRQPHGRRQDLRPPLWRSSRWRCTTASTPSTRSG